ncbi:Uncharacterized protein Fot_52552 [Forsythia ovata]|uniref:Uncharacterized protein n=1 Tax=Forsythia ovata TaxID=205694 RepID=A0ABD1PL24_9LAMI
MSFEPSRHSTSFEKFKRVEFNPNIPKTHHKPEGEVEYERSTSPTASDMHHPPPSERFDRQFNVISSSTDWRREFKEDKNPQVKTFKRTLRKMFSEEELESF